MSSEMNPASRAHLFADAALVDESSPSTRSVGTSVGGGDPAMLERGARAGRAVGAGVVVVVVAGNLVGR